MNEKTLINYGESIYDTPGKRFPIIQTFNIDTLNNGIYNLEISIEDLSNNQITKKRKKFYIIGSIVDVPLTLGYDDEISASNKEELDSIYYVIQPLLNNSEKKIFKKSNLEGKRNFLINFWSLRDPNPKTILNEYKADIEYRIKFANENFVSLFKTGASSDKGIILLKHGFPDDILTQYNISDRKPYDIWTYYELEGGVEFIFADIDGLNQFILLHSSMVGEIYNTNWEELIIVD